MFRRSRTRPRPPKSDPQALSQSPMRDAIEQELGPQLQSPQPILNGAHPEKKQAWSNDGPKKTNRPALKRTSKPPLPVSISSREKPVLNAQNKATQGYEAYVTKAKEAAIRGDVIQSEQYYQQADHYRRQMQKK